MSGSKNVIADARRWYDMNGKRPVRNKIARAEDTLAKKWSKLMKDKLNLSDELLAEADELQAQFDTGVDRLVAWMHEHKRSPKRDRGDPEDKLAQTWGRYLKKTDLLPLQLRDIQHLMSNNLEWIESEAADVALHAQCDTGVDQLAAWMHEHRRSPKRHRGDLEDKLAQTWLRYLKKPDPLPPKLQVIQGLMSNNLEWIESEAADVALHAQCNADIIAGRVGRLAA